MYPQITFKHPQQEYGTWLILFTPIASASPEHCKDVLFISVIYPERTVESPNVIVDVTISSFSSIRFFFLYFEALFLGVHT